MPAPRGASARIAAIAALLAFMIGGLFTAPASAQDAFTIDLDERNGSGISGTATLTPEGDSTTIRLQLEGPVGNNPVNIMAGTCLDFNAQPIFTLSSVDDNGVSETTIDASIDELTGDDHVINVHQSPTNLVTIFACGEIEAPASGGDDGEDDEQNAATITLATSNNSGVSGTATLTAVGDSRTAVAINVNGVSGSNLAAIFPGTCDDLDLDAAYDLDDVDGNGISNTTIDASLASLLNGEYALLISDPAIPLGQGSGLACGEIVSSIGGTTTGPATGVGVAAIDGLSGTAIGFLLSAMLLALSAGLLHRKRSRI
jgi:hypothetical protein